MGRPLIAIGVPFRRGGGEVIPPPPYAVFSEDGVHTLSLITGLTYDEGSGPSADSAEFDLLGLGLSPAADNITITPSGTDFEIFNPNDAIYHTTAFTVPYVGGAITLAGFKVRLKSGLTIDSYSGIFTITAPNTVPFVITCVGYITEMSYNVTTQAFIDRVILEGGSLTISEKMYINTFTTDIGADADNGEFDRIGVTGLSNAIARRVSVVNAATADLLTEVNSPTSDSNGYTGNGTTMYIDTNFNPTNDGVKYTLNSASIGVYVRTEADESANDIGVAFGTFSSVFPRVSNLSAAYINEAGTGAISANLSSIGLFVGDRPDSANERILKDGVALTTNAVASTTMPIGNFFLLARNNIGVADNFSTKQISFYYIGSGAINQATFYTAVQTLGTNLGWFI